MIDFEKRERQVIEWANAHGLQPSAETMRYFCNDEWKEFHSATGQRKLEELGDVFFVVTQLQSIAKNIDEEVINVRRLVRELDAIKYVDAVIASNWTKYLPTRKYTAQQARQEADSVQILYEGRYTNVQPKLSPCGNWWVIVGYEAGNEKVLKPSTYKSADDFIYL